MTNARIRAAAVADTLAIEALEKASFEWAPEDAFSKSQIRRLLVNPRAIVLVAARGGEILGWAAGLVRRHSKGRSGRIYAIAVHPGAQGMRLGRRLMERIMQELTARKSLRIYLEVDETNAGAIALYRKLGFIDDRRLPHYYAKGRHALHFIFDVKSGLDRHRTGKKFN
jgi:ribosomal-protein-alanine N-acetyltransferase